MCQARGGTSYREQILYMSAERTHSVNLLHFRLNLGRALFQSLLVERRLRRHVIDCIRIRLLCHGPQLHLELQGEIEKFAEVSSQ